MRMYANNKKKEIGITILLGVSFLVLFWRCFQGFDWSDEPFYIATANRFYLGDKFVVDDWNPAGIASLLLLPLLTVYRTIVGSTEGIILFFRFCYVFLLFLTSLYAYQTLREIKGRTIAITVTLLYLFYARFTIVTLSYNTIPQSFLMVCILMLYQSFYTGKFSKATYFLFGIFASIAVVANPYFAILYFAGMGTFLIMIVKTKEAEKRENYKTVVIYSLLGVILSATIFFGYLFSKITVDELWKALPLLFGETEYVRDVGVIRRMLRVPNAILRQYPYTIGVYTVILLYVGWKRFVRKNLTQREVQVSWLLQSVLLIANIVLSNKQPFTLGKHIGISFIACTMFGLFLYLIQEKRNWKDIIFWYLIGIISSFIFYFASNTGIYAIASGCMFSAIATIMAVKDIFEERKERKDILECILKSITVIAIVMLLVSTVVLRIFFVYRDASTLELTTKITQGPGKGIYTTEEQNRKYNEIYSILEEGVILKDKLFISKLLPWGYLCVDAECASHTTWRVPLESKRIQEYYQEKPSKIPTIIFVVNEEYGVTNDDNEKTEYWKQLIERGKYTQKSFKCGTFYRSSAEG